MNTSQKTDEVEIENILDSGKSILLFDGVCNLCNGVVKFVIKHDKDGKFVFASLQSESARTILENLDEPIDPVKKQDFSTFILIDQQNTYKKSDAAVKLLKQLDKPWNYIGKVLGIIPRFIRDTGYRIVSKYRYKVFGKKKKCMTPKEACEKKFIFSKKT